METTLVELFRVVLTVAFIAGFAWTLSVLYRYYQIDERPLRLIRMMRRLGIDASSTDEALATHYMPTAALVCRHCNSKAECDAWLANKDNAAGLPAFCANAGFLHLASAARKRVAA